MTDRYHVGRSFGGGHTIRQTDLFDDAARGGGVIVGNLLGASISGLVNVVRRERQDTKGRKMQAAADAIVAAGIAGDFERLLSLAREFTRRYPKDPEGHAWLAIALTELAQYDEAIVATDRAVLAGHDESQAHIMRADAYERKGSLNKAIQEFNALTHNPESRAEGLRGRARALMQIGDLDQALEDATQAIAASPDELGYYIRGNVYQAKGELAKSIDDYTRAYRLCPNWVNVLESRAEVYELLGRTEEAQADRDAIQSAESENPARDEARVFLARLIEGGVEVKVAPNARDLEVSGAKLRGENLDTLKRLKPQLLELLR